MRLDRPAPTGAGAGPDDQPVQTVRGPRRDKRIVFDEALLPKIDAAKQYAASEIVTAAMKVYARDPRVVSIDADLATTSGLEAGVARSISGAPQSASRSEHAAHRRGVRGAGPSHVGQHVLSVLRLEGHAPHRRRPSGASRDDCGGGWLAERGHGLDMTMLATAADFETRTNGATHMGNDDVTVFDGLAHIRISTSRARSRCCR